VRVPIVFLDANVLFSKTLRDWLFMMRVETDGGMFVLHTSEDSLTEVLYRKRKHLPQAGGSATAAVQTRVREFMDEIHDSFEGVSDFPGKDVHDSHIHAAALAAQASYLISDDRGFHEIDPELLPYEVHSTDSFLMLISENVPHLVKAVISKQLRHYEKRNDAKILSQALLDAGCPLFATRVDEHLARMARGRSSHDLKSTGL